MIVVSDTTPLRHLIPIGEAGLLWKLYGEVIVPKTVWGELHAEPAPPAITAWLGNAPSWLKVRSSRNPVTDATLGILDPGEQEAIQLAIEIHADLLLMDDRHGRAPAFGLGLPVTGTLGVLERADVVGLLSDLPATLAALEASGFYMSARLRESVLERYCRRHGLSA